MDDVNVGSLPDMGSALGTILSNPELMTKISAIAASLSGSGQQASAPIADAPPPGNAAPAGIASVLGNQQLLSKLPEVMATIAPLLSGDTAGRDDSGGEPPSSTRDERTEHSTAAAPVATIKTDTPCRAHRTALLCALKPYMSPRRREAIDYIIKIDRIGDLLHTLT